jgi:GT2 family glycosyltransferase
MPGNKPGWMSDIAGANMTYKKKIFDIYGPFIEGTYSSDTEFHWRLNKDGIRLRFEPSILVYHRNLNRMSELIKHEYEHGYNFASVRARHQKFSLLKRVFYVTGFPLFFGKILIDRLFKNSTNRRYWRNFLKAFPMLAIAIFCWSMGEVNAYGKFGYPNRIG